MLGKVKLRAAAQTTTEWEIKKRVEWGSSCVSKESLKAIVDVAYSWSASSPLKE